MIRRFIIKGFKRFERETVIDLDDVTVLVGANNSGKSTILHALTLFQYCVETTRKSNGNGPGAKNTVLARRSVRPDEFGVLPMADPADLWPNGRAAKNRKAVPIELRAEFQNGATVSFQLKISYNRFSIVPKVEGELPKIIEREIRLIPIFSGFLPREEYLTLPARQDRMRLQRHGEMVRNLLWELKEHAKPQWRELQQLLAELFPESAIEVSFDLDVDRFLNATYHDPALTRERDLIAAGSGFHQALQILASVLAPGTGVLLLDEPDAHLHARLQGRLMGIFTRLAKRENIQFVIATHSPQILNAAPEGSIRACSDGRIDPLHIDSGHIGLLDDLGAMDRMELVPLLTNRAVVFVENKSDRKLLEAFGDKYWGEKKRQDVWRALTFLHTYQNPMDAGVLNLGRQVRDLIDTTGIETSRAIRIVAIGDRDYRSDSSRQDALREYSRKAKSDAYKLDMKLVVWEANEIENHLLDRNAILQALDQQARETGDHATTRWRKLRRAFEEEFNRLVNSQRNDVLLALATRIQQEGRGLALKTAMEKADEFLAGAGELLEPWCDAKRVLRGLRAWIQNQSLPLRIVETEIIQAMEVVPTDVQKALQVLDNLSGTARRRRRLSVNARKK